MFLANTYSVLLEDVTTGKCQQVVGKCKRFSEQATGTSVPQVTVCELG